MAKEAGIEVDNCVVEEVLGGDRFRVKLPNDNIVICHLSGKVRKNHIRILLGDRIIIELSPYDLTNGRIIFRYKN